MKAPLEKFGITPVSVLTPFQFRDVNMLLYDGADALTLFDAAVRFDFAWDALVEALSTKGAKVGDIGRVILTHHHFDHVGLLGSILQESGAELCGHPEIPMESEMSYSFDDTHNVWFSKTLTEMGAPPEIVTEFLKHRQMLKLLVEPLPKLDRELPDGCVIDGFTVRHVPGHSATDTIFIHEQRGFTVVGDHVLEAINPNPIIRRPQPGQERTTSLIQYQESLALTRSLELGWCLGGHGKPFHDHRRVIERIVQRHEERNASILTWILPQGITPYEATHLMYKKIDPEVLYFCLSIAVGQLELLESRGQLHSRFDDGIIRFYPIKKD